MSDFAGRTAVITGGAGGIGRAIALALAALKINLCLIDRRVTMLEAVAAEAQNFGVEARYVSADLAQDAELAKLGSALRTDPGSIDILVHAAAIIEPGAIEQSSLADFDKHHKLNARAPYELTRLLLPILKARKGEIIFINSSAGMGGRPLTALYDSSKNALRALAQSLRGEINKDGVRVLSVYPGRTASQLQAKIHRFEGKQYRPELLLQPEDIAAVVVSALSLPRTAEVTDIHIRPMIKS
jgi:short-subunit dehydrogenase